MGKQTSFSSTAGPTRRAWRLLRLALLWARKGGLLKCKLMAELRHGAKHLKSGLHYHNNNNKHSRDMIRYGGERELSFDDTPIIHLKMSRPNSLRFMIPCIKPDVVDFDYDFGDDDDGYDGVGRRSFLLGCEAGDHDDQLDLVKGEREDEEEEEEEEEGIDLKAEEFIAKFYNQMKLQREISFQRRNNNANIQVCSN